MLRQLIMNTALPEQQFLEAYDTYADALFRHCYFRVFEREQAKDLVQEVFMKTWEYMVQGNQVKNIRALLYRIANNMIIDAWRKKKALSLEALQEEGFQPAMPPSNLHAMIEGKEAAMLLQQLEPSYREVVVMRYIDDLSPKEIAEVLGESADAVSVRIHRGLEKVRQLMKM